MPLVGRAYDSGFPVDKPNNRTTDLARVALDSSWATERSETGRSASRPSPYPSPPMSGSPHTLHKATSEASDLALIPSNYSSAVPQDAYGGTRPNHLRQTHDPRKATPVFRIFILDPTPLTP
uniref:Uncharacterized protein n=1 Tax=Bionectria ochroleuca TaxID=29856 RepID=A0A8H7NPJ8_BIOOC